jgi:hypothetical protein
MEITKKYIRHEGGLYPKAKDRGIIKRRKLIIQTESHESSGI